MQFNSLHSRLYQRRRHHSRLPAWPFGDSDLRTSEMASMIQSKSAAGLRSMANRTPCSATLRCNVPKRTLRTHLRPSVAANAGVQDFMAKIASSLNEGKKASAISQAGEYDAAAVKSKMDDYIQNNKVRPAAVPAVGSHVRYLLFLICVGWGAINVILLSLRTGKPLGRATPWAGLLSGGALCPSGAR